MYCLLAGKLYTMASLPSTNQVNSTQEFDQKWSRKSCFKLFEWSTRKCQEQFFSMSRSRVIRMHTCHGAFVTQGAVEYNVDTLANKAVIHALTLPNQTPGSWLLPFKCAVVVFDNVKVTSQVLYIWPQFTTPKLKANSPQLLLGQPTFFWLQGLVYGVN